MPTTGHSGENANPRDPGQVRYAIAGWIKGLIAARLRDEPAFISEKDRHAWEIPEIPAEGMSTASMLRRVKVFRDKFTQNHLASGTSIQVPGDETEDRVDQLINSAAEFLKSDLDDAIKLAVAGKSIPWKRLANWHKLPEIRRVLDELPHPGKKVSKNDFEVTGVPVAESTRVKLFPKSSKPVAIIDHEQILSLTPARYDVIRALLTAHEMGLTKDELVSLSGHTDAVGVLRRLVRNDKLWQSVIQFAGMTGRKYRIA